MPDNDRDEQRAAEYVLGHMEPRARAEFEARLAVSPSLRAEVQELETACEALALSAPQLRPPRRVWRAIAERTSVPRAEAVPGVQSWRFWMKFAWRSGWAAAACLALAWWLQVQKQDDEAESDPLSFVEDESRVPVPRRVPRAETFPVVPPERRSAGAELVDAAPTAPSLQPEKKLDAEEESRRMREWVQQLADEVADLHRRLARETTLPAGASRLQLFRLSPTNNAGTMSMDQSGPRLASAEQRALEQWLAGALAQQLVMLGENPREDASAAVPEAPEPNDEAAPVPTPTNIVALTSGNPITTFEVVELASAPSSLTPVPLGSAFDGATAGPGVNPPATEFQNMAFGFYSADTGTGVITLAVSPREAHQTLQFWALDNEGGSPVSLGTTDSSAAFLMVNFSMHPALLLTNPRFVVTIEPPGGSTTPTGPIVVAPPAGKTP